MRSTPMALTAMANIAKAIRLWNRSPRYKQDTTKIKTTAPLGALYSNDCVVVYPNDWMRIEKKLQKILKLSLVRASVDVRLSTHLVKAP